MKLLSISVYSAVIAIKRQCLNKCDYDLYTYISVSLYYPKIPSESSERQSNRIIQQFVALFLQRCRITKGST